MTRAAETVKKELHPARGLDEARFVKALGWINGAVPLGMMMWDSLSGKLGKDPTDYVFRTSGLLTLIFFILMLLVTPVRKLLRIQSLSFLRRIFGLYAFFYALIHFLIYFTGRGQSSVSFTFEQVLKIQYLQLGMLALLLMVPLAVTSTSGMVRRLGAHNWKRLHMLAYVAAIGGGAHFLLQPKVFTAQGMWFFGIIAGLVALRPILWISERVMKHGGAQSEKNVHRWRGRLKVKSIRRETPDVQTFELVAAEGNELPFAYEAGQYLTLQLNIDGKKVLRNYTIASSPTRAGSCELTIKRESMGAGSRHMHDVVKAGDHLDVAAPAGEFTITDEKLAGVRGIVLLAGGVGITPLMSMLRAIVDRKIILNIFLIYSNKTPSDVIFEKELEELKARAPHLTIVHTLTRDVPADWKGERGRIDAAMLRRIVGDVTAYPYYFCGPAEMLKNTTAMLKSLGVPPENIHQESFGSRPTAATMNADGKIYTVTYNQSGKTSEVSRKYVLLEAAEEAGVPADYECRSGTCGTCKCRLVAGTVEMDSEDALTPDEKAAGVILLCQARATSDVELEL